MKKIIVSALAIAAMAGCSESGESGVKIGTMAAAFSSSITTRASGTEWEAGDAIGIMATSENQLLEWY
ncbi:MAG: fimbrillin family protein, partial [Rikenellaceae bacterium]